MRNIAVLDASMGIEKPFLVTATGSAIGKSKRVITQNFALSADLSKVMRTSTAKAKRPKSLPCRMTASNCGNVKCAAADLYGNFLK